MKTKSIYDNWGKRTRITDFLNKSVNYTYTRTNNTYQTLEATDDGSASFAQNDALGRVIIKGTKDINGAWHYKETQYDALGRKFRESEPYFANESATQWNGTVFDKYSRTAVINSFTGKSVSFVYDGLSTTIDDGTLIKKTTKNANGHTIQSTDTPGGNIDYSYDAGGNLIESNYDGIALTMQYDDWGRKTALNDPSAGLYGYSYNAFGEILTESTPKGTTTYKYDLVGKVIEKHIVGNTPEEKTDIKSTYVYDPDTKLLTQINIEDPYNGTSDYSYGYDELRRVISTTEKLPFATFTKSVSFDDFGRVQYEMSEASAHGKSSKITVMNTYKNGNHFQIIDTRRGTVLWQANTVNARGQLTNAILGNNIAINNTYDLFSYPKAINHSLYGVDKMALNYTFDAKRGNLLNRSSSLFGTYEAFEYDNNDRLTTTNKDGFNILNLNFDNDTEGFEPIINDDLVYSNSAKLVVHGNYTGSGTKRLLIENSVAGTKLRISADIFKSPTSPGVKAIIREIDPNTGDQLNEQFFATTNGLFDKNYTIAYSNANVIFCLEFMQMRGPAGNGNISLDPDGLPISPRTFTVDNFKLSYLISENQDYDERGRISGNTIGKYAYDRDKPFQNSLIDLNSESAEYYSQRPLLNITYNAFKSPLDINEESIDRLTFWYNGMQGRSALFYGSTAKNPTDRPYSKYYSADGSVEIKHDSKSDATEFIHYIGGDAYTADIIFKQDDRNQDYFYLHRDHLGSILAISSSDGQIVEQRHFDAWGNIAHVADGNGNALEKLTFFDRGYTGHEHLQSVGLVHMNGRLYDPKLHRFLQPDNFVQQPDNTQNYNRYAYCVNNPLKYTDPSGEEITLLGAIAISAAVALFTYTATAFLADVPFTLQGAVQTVVMASFTAAVTFGIGSGTAAIKSFALRATTQAVAHGTFNGAMSGIQGGKFWNGFAAGAASSAAASLFSGGTNHNGLDEKGAQIGSHGGFGGVDNWMNLDGSTAGMIAFGTISGGAGAHLSGGNFWQGAVTGLLVSTVNHYAHDGGKNQQPKPKKDKWDLNGDGKLQKNEADQWGLNHGGDITIDGNKIDIKGFNVKNTTYSSKKGIFGYPTTKVFKDLPIETAATFGGSCFKLVNGKFQMQGQLYHYDMRPSNSIENIGRNALTIVGYPCRVVSTPVGPTAVYFEKTFQPYFINVKY